MYSGSDVSTTSVIIGLILVLLVATVSIVAVTTCLLLRWRRVKRRMANVALDDGVFAVPDLDVILYEDVGEHIYDRISNFCGSEDGYDTIKKVEIDDLYEQILMYELIARYESISDEVIAHVLLNDPRDYEQPKSRIVTRPVTLTLRGDTAYDTSLPVNLNGGYERVPQVNVQQLLREAAGSQGPHNSAQTYEQVPRASIANILRQAALEEQAQTYERVPQVNISRILRKFSREYGIYERAQTYERVPYFDITQILRETPNGEDLYERAQTYERVPDVNIARILREVSNPYERVPNFNVAQLLGEEGVYERVPNFNVAQLLGEKGVYERARTYERVPNVDIAQILSEAALREQNPYERAQTYERVPDVDIAQILRQASHDPDRKAHNEGAQVYERVPYFDLAQLLAEVPIYEQVPHSSKLQIIFNTLLTVEVDVEESSDLGSKNEETHETAVSGDIGEDHSEGTQPTEESSTYERVYYTKEVDQVVQGLLAKDLSCETAYERIQYSSAIEQMFVEIAAIQTRDKDERGGKTKNP
jgi:hypothetical protein